MKISFNKWPFVKKIKPKHIAAHSISQKSVITKSSFTSRAFFVFIVLVAAAVLLIWKAITLQFVESGFLRDQGDRRFVRVAPVIAHRGNILDRAGEPLAVSTPVDSVWVSPREVFASARIAELAANLNINSEEFTLRMSRNLDRSFLYVARQLQPADAARVKALGISGVHLKREYRRYYPTGEVAGHILGFTNVDDSGQEGLELNYEPVLRGEDGAKRVIQDRDGHIVQDVESIRSVRPGRDVALSLDMRIQYLAYRELKAAIQSNRARSGSVVVIDVTTGEVLAMVNQPTFNPNDRNQFKADGYKNRALTDMLEPGSAIKPFIVAAGLSAGLYNPLSIINTGAGLIKVGTKYIQDHQPLGSINLTTALAKSSNVALVQIGLTLGPQRMHAALSKLGFGQASGTGYPGESAGIMTPVSNMKPINIATMSYGYGLSVTPLQLAHAYATLGAGGISRPLTFRKVDSAIEGEQIIPKDIASVVLNMLETVVSQEGTGMRASIPGYRIAGKTGTARKLVRGTYSKNQYVAVFAGLAPASNPRLATVIVIDEPSMGSYYGGDVSAPVFAKIVGGSLRLLGVAPDAAILRNVDEMPSTVPGFETGSQDILLDVPIETVKTAILSSDSVQVRR